MVVVAVATGLFFGLGDLGDQRLGGEQQRRHARGVLQGCPHNLGRIDDASGHQITIFFLVGVVAVVLALHVAHPVDHHRAVHSGVGGDGLKWITERVLHNRGAHLLVPFEVEFLHSLLAAEQGDAPSRHDSFGERRLRGAAGILDERLPLLHLGFRGCANVDLSHAASQFGQSLLQFLTVVIAVGVFDFGTDLGHPTFDSRL